MVGNVALENGHVGADGRFVQGGGDLIQTAAPELGHAVFRMGRGEFKSGGLSQSRHGIIKGENLARLHDEAVEIAAGQSHVAVVAFIAAEGGGAEGQLLGILQDDIQRLGHDIFHGNGDGLPVGSLGQCRLGILQAEGIAAGTRGDLQRFGVLYGLHRRHGQLRMDGVQIDGLGRDLRRDLHLELPAVIGVQNGVIDAVRIQHDAGSAHGEEQRLAWGVLGKLFCRQLGAFPFQRIAGGGDRGVSLCDGFLQRCLDIAGVQPQIGEQTDDGVLPVDAAGSVHGALHIQRRQGLGSRQCQALTVQNHDHVVVGVTAAHGFFYGLHGLLPGHTAHIHTCDADAGKQSVPGRIGIPAVKQKTGGNGKEQQNHQCGDDFFAVPAHPIGEFAPMVVMVMVMGFFIFLLKNAFVYGDLQSGGTDPVHRLLGSGIPAGDEILGYRLDFQIQIGQRMGQLLIGFLCMGRGLGAEFLHKFLGLFFISHGRASCLM